MAIHDSRVEVLLQTFNHAICAQSYPSHPNFPGSASECALCVISSQGCGWDWEAFRSTGNRGSF